MQALLIAAPLCSPPAFCRRWLSFVIREGVEFFPMTLKMEDDGRNLVAGRPYVIGTRPSPGEVLSAHNGSFVSSNARRPPTTDVLTHHAVLRSYAGFEPHSALPFAMPGVFSEYSGLMPPALKDVRTVASSAVRRPVQQSPAVQVTRCNQSLCVLPNIPV